jgi:uncharacterized protein
VHSCTIEIKLRPRARKDSIEPDTDGRYKVSVTSPAVENKANEHCLSLLAKKLKCPKSALSIIKGGHNRNKVIACEAMTIDDADKLLREQNKIDQLNK